MRNAARSLHGALKKDENRLAPRRGTRNPSPEGISTPKGPRRRTHVGTMTCDPSPSPKLESHAFPAEDPRDLCPEPLKKSALFSPSAKGLQCPAPRAPAFPTASASSGTNERWSRAASREA